MRELWHPSWLTLGLKPWELDRLTPDELSALQRWIREQKQHSED